MKLISLIGVLCLAALVVFKIITEGLDETFGTITFGEILIWWSVSLLIADNEVKKERKQ